MRYYLLFIVCCSSLAQFESACAANSQASGIHWMTNYEEAASKARQESKPMVLLFTGSDWCSWCQKLDHEVLNTQVFASAVNHKFIFVKLDFPLYSQSDPKEMAQNKELQKKFDVRGFPTLIILNSSLKQIGTVGYRSGGANEYALHLLRIVSDYAAYSQKMEEIDNQTIAGTDLKILYQKAKELNLESDTNKIIRIGMQSDENSFFLLERYRFLVSEGSIHNQEAVALRAQLMASDPHNKKSVPYRIAIIDFENCCERMSKKDSSPEAIIAPLINYIQHYSASDKENLWRLQMIISQVYLDKNRSLEALKYTKEAYSSAPPSAKADIAKAIKNIQFKSLQ